MQFANQAISYFVSGFLCIIWIFLPMLGIADATELLKNILKQINANGSGMIGLLFVFPFAYALGNAVNALANWCFSLKDQRIRTHVLNLIKKISKQPVIEKDIEKIKDYIALENDNEIFNFYRFKCYLSGTELYDFFGLHREIIRILRATSFNAFMVFLALFTISDCLYIKCLGYLAMATFLITIVISKGKLSINPLHWLSHDYGFLIITLGLFFTVPVGLIVPASTTHLNYLYLGNLFLFISSLSSKAWEKQQEDFYLSMIRAHVTSMIDNNHKEESKNHPSMMNPQ